MATILPFAHRGECGLSSNKKDIDFPFFRMGCCGDQESVVYIGLIPIPQKMDMKFFERVSKLLKTFPHYDWDWTSFAKNVIHPNRAHIQETLQLDDFFTERVMNDLYVVLDNWDEVNDDECDVPLSHKTFFTCKNCEY